MTAYEIDDDEDSSLAYIGCYADSPYRGSANGSAYLTGNMTNEVSGGLLRLMPSASMHVEVKDLGITFELFLPNDGSGNRETCCVVVIFLPALPPATKTG